MALSGDLYHDTFTPQKFLFHYFWFGILFQIPTWHVLKPGTSAVKNSPWQNPHVINSHIMVSFPPCPHANHPSRVDPDPKKKRRFWHVLVAIQRSKRCLKDSVKTWSTTLLKKLDINGCN